MRKNIYELEPGTEFEYEEPCGGEDYCEIDFNEDYPYKDYKTYDLTVEETAKKVIRVYAKDAKSAELYLTEFLDEIDMAKNIDEYEKRIALVEESDSIADYTVPVEWYE